MNNLSNDDFSIRETMSGNTQTVIYDKFACMHGSSTTSAGEFLFSPFVYGVKLASGAYSCSGFHLDKVLSTSANTQNDSASLNETADIF